MTFNELLSNPSILIFSIIFVFKKCLLYLVCLLALSCQPISNSKIWLRLHSFKARLGFVVFTQALLKISCRDNLLATLRFLSLFVGIRWIVRIAVCSFWFGALFGHSRWKIYFFPCRICRVLSIFRMDLEFLFFKLFYHFLCFLNLAFFNFGCFNRKDLQNSFLK